MQQTISAHLVSLLLRQNDEYADARVGSFAVLAAQTRPSRLRC